MTEDRCNAKHELYLLLERVDGLARDGSNCEQRAESRCDRDGPTQSAGCCDAAPRGTDERQRKLMIGVVRMSHPQLLDLRLDGGLAALHRVGESAEHRAELRRQVIEVHFQKRTAEAPGQSRGQGADEKESHMREADLNTKLRLSRDKP